jgi:hypothetical protein
MDEKVTKKSLFVGFVQTMVIAGGIVATMTAEINRTTLILGWVAVLGGLYFLNRWKTG